MLNASPHGTNDTNSSSLISANGIERILKICDNAGRVSAEGDSPVRHSMPHDTPLITLIVVGLGLAFIFGLIASRCKISPLVGYLLAGTLIGPGTPGYVADAKLAQQLAEIGVILLMFGVGLHFSVRDLLSVRRVAIPGAIGQMSVATLLGLALALYEGWSIGAGIIFGLALSVASTVVLLRALQENRIVETERGRIAVGWLIVEDMAMVFILVLLPGIAGLLGGVDSASSDYGVWFSLVLTVGKFGAFLGAIFIIGRRTIPWLLHAVARSGSRELFRLSVFAIALGVAYISAELFGMSFALGAFFAGMLLNESRLSHRVAEESLPLRDAFAVLFFVSVGMLFDPAVVTERPIALLLTVLIIVVGKTGAAYLIVRLFKYPSHTAHTVAASLAQIGEFSFILAGLGLTFEILPKAGHDLILAGAIISILLNPAVFKVLSRWKPDPERAVSPVSDPRLFLAGQYSKKGMTPIVDFSGHSILVGYGRVGTLLTKELDKEGQQLVIIEEDKDQLRNLPACVAAAIIGNAANEGVLESAGVAAAEWIYVAIPETFEAGQVIERAREKNLNAVILARAHSVEDEEYLYKCGATNVVMGEREVAKNMARIAFGN